MKFIYLIYAICFIVITNACSNVIEDNSSPSGKILQDQQEISFKNGMMILNSSHTLNQILQNKLSYTNVVFTSQQDILDKLIIEEQNHAISLRDLSDIDYATAKKHSDLYYTLLQEKFIKVDKFTDGSELYSLNIAMPNYGKVLNLDGFFAIQDTIYQITPDKLKMWINGNLNNCSILNKINTDDIAKGIYVFDYNQKVQEAIQTRASIPIIKAINQEIAYYSENNSFTSRGIISFYDKTTLNIPAGGYNRNVYIRISFQEKLDGRNYSFATAPYFFSFTYATEDAPNENKSLYMNGQGSDDWYTVYFQYQFLNPGKDVQLITTSEEYKTLSFIHLIGNFYYEEISTNISHPKRVYTNFRGDTNTWGSFTYSPEASSSQLIPSLPE